MRRARSLPLLFAATSARRGSRAVGRGARRHGRHGRRGQHDLFGNAAGSAHSRDRDRRAGGREREDPDHRVRQRPGAVHRQDDPQCRPQFVAGDRPLRLQSRHDQAASSPFRWARACCASSAASPPIPKGRQSELRSRRLACAAASPSSRIAQRRARRRSLASATCRSRRFARARRQIAHPTTVSVTRPGFGVTVAGFNSLPPLPAVQAARSSRRRTGS